MGSPYGVYFEVWLDGQPISQKDDGTFYFGLGYSGKYPTTYTKENLGDTIVMMLRRFGSGAKLEVRAEFPTHAGLQPG